MGAAAVHADWAEEEPAIDPSPRFSFSCSRSHLPHVYSLLSLL